MCPVRAFIFVPHSVTSKLAGLIAQRDTHFLLYPSNLVRTVLLCLLLLLNLCVRRRVPLVPLLHAIDIVGLLRRAEQSEVRTVVEPFQPTRTMIVTGRRIELISTFQRLGLCSTPIEIVAKVVILFQLHLEEGYGVQQLLSGSWILREHVRRSDLLDRFVQIAPYSVLASTMQVSFL